MDGGFDHGDPDKDLTAFPVFGGSSWINHRHRWPRIVGLHHGTRGVPIAEGHARALPEGCNLPAESGEAVTIGMIGPVFLP